jgi:hypothetical protein
MVDITPAELLFSGVPLLAVTATASVKTAVSIGRLLQRIDDHDNQIRALAIQMSEIRKGD